MAMMERPQVTFYEDGGKSWGHTFEQFDLKVFVPATKIDGEVNNYTFRAPLLLVFEETKRSMEEAIAFAKESGLAEISLRASSRVTLSAARSSARTSTATALRRTTWQRT